MTKDSTEGLKNQATGTAKKVAGSIESGFGKVTGNTKTEVKGEIKKAEGSVQQAAGEAQRKMGKAINN